MHSDLTDTCHFDFFFWDFSEDGIYADNPRTVKEEERPRERARPPLFRNGRRDRHRIKSSPSAGSGSAQRSSNGASTLSKTGGCWHPSVRLTAGIVLGIPPKKTQEILNKILACCRIRVIFIWHHPNTGNIRWHELHSRLCLWMTSKNV